MTYFLLFIISFVLTYLVKKYLIHKSIFADINHRSSHTIPTPAGGGVAISITWFFGLLYLQIYNKIDITLFSLLILGILIFAIGLYDDLVKTITPKLRLVLQSLISIIALYILGGLNSINLGFYEITNSVVTNIFAFFLIIWFINLYNFIDGIDGYASSEAIFLALAGFLLFGDSHFLVLNVAVLGFWIWNFPSKFIGGRAKIFMGDSSSTLIGYNIAIFTLYYANESSLNLWIWILLFSLFWVDATYTLVKRIIQGKNPTQAHKEHIYQKLVKYGWSHGKVVIVGMSLNILLFILIIKYLI
jgi:Fuc2NAc and GlcNAc transferase